MKDYFHISIQGQLCLLTMQTANNTQLNVFFTESECDKAVEQSKCLLCKICFDWTNKAVCMGHLLGHTALLVRILVEPASMKKGSLSKLIE